MEPISQRAREVISYIKETGTTGLAVLLVAFYLGQAAGLVPDVHRADHLNIAEVITQTKNDQIKELKYQNTLLEEIQRSTTEATKLAESSNETTRALVRSMCFLIPGMSKREQNDCVNAAGRPLSNGRLHAN